MNEKKNKKKNEKKIIVEQVEPSCQKSLLSLSEDFWPENILVFGNRNFNKHMEHSKYGELYEYIDRIFDEMAREYEFIKDKNSSFYANVTELFQNYFSKSEFDAINVNLNNKKVIHEFKLLLEEYETDRYYKGTVQIDMLSLLTGLNWRKCTINGFSQSEWNEILYPMELVSDNDIRIFEMDYFNIGTEWLFPDGDASISIYCYGITYDEIKQEIADAFDVNAADIKLKAFSHYGRVAHYEFF